MPTDDMRMVRDGWMGGGGDDDDCSIRVIVDVIMIMCRRLECFIFQLGSFAINLLRPQVNLAPRTSQSHPPVLQVAFRSGAWSTAIGRLTQQNLHLFESF